MRRALELGVNFIDTADAYGPEVSERLIAEVLHPYPKDLVIATKGGNTRPSASEWVADGTPKHLREACMQSLKRLKLERIDLYQLHAIDSKVPLEESLGELARLQKEGKIRHIGVSNFKLDELVRAQRVVPVVSVQNRYNVVDRCLPGRARLLHARAHRLHSLGAAGPRYARGAPGQVRGRGVHKNRRRAQHQ